RFVPFFFFFYLFFFSISRSGGTRAFSLFEQSTSRKRHNGAERDEDHSAVKCDGHDIRSHSLLLRYGRDEAEKILRTAPPLPLTL
ncbi:hypothetical protein BKA81DRAFT_343648, partial [Phyllosticta paracitricarpa]